MKLVVRVALHNVIIENLVIQMYVMYVKLITNFPM